VRAISLTASATIARRPYSRSSTRSTSRQRWSR
jgi:hypothetical protein